MQNSKPRRNFRFVRDYIPTLVTLAGYNIQLVVSSKKNIVKPYSGGITCPQACKNYAAIVQLMDDAIHWINLYLKDNAIGLIFLVVEICCFQTIIIR